MVLSALGVRYLETCAAFAVRPGKEVAVLSLERKAKKSKHNAANTNTLVQGKKETPSV